MLYESVDHGPVTLKDISGTYLMVADLTRGLESIVDGLLDDAADDQYGRLRVITCCLSAIEGAVFRINPESVIEKMGERHD